MTIGFKKKLQNKISFTIHPVRNGWHVYISKKLQSSSGSNFPICPIPTANNNINITYVEETSNDYAFVVTECNAFTMTTTANQFSKETKVLAPTLYSITPSQHTIMITINDSNEIYINPKGFKNERLPWTDNETIHFGWNCSSDKMTFYADGSTIMELEPVFSTTFPLKTYIQGWILVEWEYYIPYLCSIIGFSYLS